VKGSIGYPVHEKFADEGRVVDLCVLPAKKCKRLTKR
jgi:hypothetical protein